MSTNLEVVYLSCAYHSHNPLPVSQMHRNTDTLPFFFIFKCLLYSKISSKHLQCLTTNESMQLLTAFTENEEIYSFLIYVTNWQQQTENKEVDGFRGHALISSWISPVDLTPHSHV
ncbi:hypothetical protein XENOCAPTIV_003465 [Xenoophorus captivus]|uniref:Uncharacterized protein n=1 Tax=Xenoophorus captivus TaxID=1517983 RepID=A0ABV0QG72_9TELE